MRPGDPDVMLVFIVAYYSLLPLTLLLVGGTIDLAQRVVARYEWGG
jgi:hypothetical protein